MSKTKIEVKVVAIPTNSPGFGQSTCVTLGEYFRSTLEELIQNNVNQGWTLHGCERVRKEKL